MLLKFIKVNSPHLYYIFIISVNSCIFVYYDITRNKLSTGQPNMPESTALLQVTQQNFFDKI